MGDVAYRDQEYWTKGGQSDAASAAWADANRTDTKQILSAWSEVNQTLFALREDHQQLRLQLANLQRQLAAQEMHKAVAEYGYLMKNPASHELMQIIIVGKNLRAVPVRTKRTRVVINQTRRERDKHTLADQRDEVKYSGVRALRPFRDATGAALLGAVVSGLMFGWAGDKQTIEIIGATVGVIAYVVARITSAHAKSQSHS